MSRTSKYKKSTLNKFKDLTDEELLLAVQKAIYEYAKIKKSIEEANEILLKYNQSKIYSTYTSKLIYDRYNRLIDCTKFRNLNVPEEWYEVEIEEQDIIDRLNEKKHEELKWIDEHCYLFDLCDQTDGIEELSKISNEKDKTDEELWPSDEEANEISLLYEKIIVNEFGKNKKCKKLRKEQK